MTKFQVLATTDSVTLVCPHGEDLLEEYCPDCEQDCPDKYRRALKKLHCFESEE